MSVAWVGAGVAAVGVGVSASNGKKSAKAASKASDAGSAYAADLQQQQFDQTRQDNAAGRVAGSASTNRLAELMGIDTAQAKLDEAAQQIKSLFPNWYTGDQNSSHDIVNSFLVMAPEILGSSELQQKWMYGPDQLSNLGSLLPQAQAAMDAQNAPRSADFGALTKKFTLADYEADPGYAFRLTEGQKALDRSAAARGGLQSGSALKAAARFGQDYASNEYGNAYTRFNTDQSTKFNRLASLAGIGQTANAASAAAGQNYANQAGGYAMTNAANQGNAALAAGNARGAGYTGLANALGSIKWPTSTPAATSAPFASGWDAGYYGADGMPY